jgi:hypothetical protein
VKCSGIHPCDKCQHHHKECVFEEDRKIVVSEEYDAVSSYLNILVDHQTFPVYETEVGRGRQSALYREEAPPE